MKTLQEIDPALGGSNPGALVDALNLVFGKQVHGRAVHAKGVVLQGQFVPTPAASTLSKALHFQNVAVPVTVRFSAFAGVPFVADAEPLANPRGLALKFFLPDGTETDLVTHSFNGFPAATADEFQRFLIALGTSGGGVPSPTPAERYLAAHPIAKTFVETQQPPPVSYATLAYFGVNSFKFTNAAGTVQIGRYRIEPRAGVQFLPEAERATAARDYLADEIRRRIAREPVRFDVRVQLAEGEDRIDDPSIAWPDARKAVDVGLLEISVAVADSDAAERALLFMPAVLPEGIEPADPMIQIRNTSYPVSYERRHR